MPKLGQASGVPGLQKGVNKGSCCQGGKNDNTDRRTKGRLAAALRTVRTFVLVDYVERIVFRLVVRQAKASLSESLSCATVPCTLSPAVAGRRSQVTMRRDWGREMTGRFGTKGNARAAVVSCKLRRNVCAP